ncbi:MAG TPA: formylglycine-generating enzyme family protein [Gallionella sp.]|nr:formylglycine-generating enzyme family protein [Gallionella sp.]
MKALLGVMIATLCLTVIPPQAHAAKAGKAGKAAQPAKERLVLMPLRVADDDKKLQGAMETALVEGLQQKYVVFSGEQVAQKAREIFMKESRNTAKRDCDETRCMQNIAESFQAELIATANVTKQDGGYFLALSIQNIFDNKVEYSKTLTCKNCDTFQVVDKLKELSGALAAPPAADNTPTSGAAADPETTLWYEVKTTNTIDEYQTYLTQYPKGKYVDIAKSSIKKMQDEAANEGARKEQQAWQGAEQTGSETGYQGYLNDYPHGKYAWLAQVKIRKLKNDVAEEAAQWQTVQTSEDSKIIQSYLDNYPNGSHVAAAQDKLAAVRKAEANNPKAGAIIRDCPECPEMVVIPIGSFNMGSSKDGTESPAHSVTIREAFALGKTEITQAQWKAVMGNNPSNFKDCGDNCPVEKVSWDDAKEFIQKLSAKTGKQYRLPSEAEWEYACRAGGENEYCGSDKVDSVAWYAKNSRIAWVGGKTTHPVAQKQANSFGLYDMSGNVWEWTEDSWHDNYNGAPDDGSAWLGDGAKRVLHGGSWVDNPYYERSAFRDNYAPAYRSNDLGFRVARTLP